MKKGRNRMAMLLILVVGISIGYASLATNLKINGTSVVKGANWNIYWDNVNVDSGSVTGSNVVTAPSTTGTTTTEVDFSVVLPEPGDFYEFTVDAVNAGSIDAMIDNNGVLNKVYTDSTYTEEATLPKVLKYTVTYADGRAIEEKHLLAKKDGSTPTIEKYKVRVEYRNDEAINPSDLDKDNDRTYYFKFAVTYVQADATARKVRLSANFATSSWNDIIEAYEAGETEELEEAMRNGTTRQIDMGTFGKHDLRIANLSKCTNGETSETACGLVIEFANILIDHAMNDTATNVGGWKDSSMRTYVNTDVYNALPIELRNAIIDTKVISGHGATAGEENFETTDKMYLFSSKEVWGVAANDTVDSETRQLDYYASRNVGICTNYQFAIKDYDESYDWYLRSAHSGNTTQFVVVSYIGGCRWIERTANDGGFLSPAFRIHE